jgi:L-ascorbate metabolism protein UlaG (beta-lactamase superfamily)
MNSLTFLGHSCFKLESKQHILLFDPYFTNNPQAVTSAADINCNYILPSHAHHDHLGDAIPIALRTGATIIASVELAKHCSEKGCQTHAMQIGGKFPFDFGSVRLTYAQHSSGLVDGLASGFIVSFHGTTVYFAGDTGIFSDMELIGKLEAIDYAILPIGGNYTMNVEDAVLAGKMLNPKAIIPMHYNTWPIINADPLVLKQALNIPVHILSPGEKINLIAR